MRFNLPEDILQTQNAAAETNDYLGLSKEVIDNETIPLPPGLSRIRTIRKIHLELNVVREQLREWDSVQERLVSTLNVLGVTAQKLADASHSTAMVNKLQQDCCYLQNEVQCLQDSSKTLDPHFNQKSMAEDGYIAIPNAALHYLAVYDDNPWEQ